VAINIATIRPAIFLIFLKDIGFLQKRLSSF